MNHPIRESRLRKIGIDEKERMKGKANIIARLRRLLPRVPLGRSPPLHIRHPRPPKLLLDTRT